jgi:hypothetical protein
VATYLQWARSRPVRRVTWVCGPEVVLAREVVAAHRAGANPDQCVTLFAGDTPEREIWDLLLSAPPGGGRRVVVYGAEELKGISAVAVLAEEDSLATAFVVLVSSAADFEREGGALAPHLAALQSAKSAQLVRCCAPSKLDDRIALVSSWWPGAARGLAHDVLIRSGNLERAWHACAQARMAGLKPEARMVAVVCPGEPAGDLADLLMAGNRRAAAAAVRDGAGEAGLLIGLLASRLAVAEQVADGMRGGLPAREAASRARIDRFVASRVLPYVASYDMARVRYCRRLLAGLESAWKSGARDGVIEALVALW